MLHIIQQIHAIWTFFVGDFLQLQRKLVLLCSVCSFFGIFLSTKNPQTFPSIWVGNAKVPDPMQTAPPTFEPPYMMLGASQDTWATLKMRWWLGFVGWKLKIVVVWFGADSLIYAKVHVDFDKKWNLTKFEQSYPNQCDPENNVLRPSWGNPFWSRAAQTPRFCLHMATGL